MPTNFDLAFRRARETIMLEGSKLITSLKKNNENAHQGVLDPVPTEEKTEHNSMREKMAETGLKGTTQRDGGDGSIIDDQRK